MTDRQIAMSPHSRAQRFPELSNPPLQHQGGHVNALPARQTDRAPMGTVRRHYDPLVSATAAAAVAANYTSARSGTNITGDITATWSSEWIRRQTGGCRPHYHSPNTDVVVLFPKTAQRQRTDDSKSGKLTEETSHQRAHTDRHLPGNREGGVTEETSHQRTHTDSHLAGNRGRCHTSVHTQTATWQVTGEDVTPAYTHRQPPGR